MLTLAGKNVLVTGASSGIGRAIALSVAELGAEVHLSGRNIPRLQSVQSQLTNPDKHRIYPGDLTDSEVLDDLLDCLPLLDGVVLAAGKVKLLPVRYITPRHVEDLFQTNVFSSIAVVQGLLKRKKIKKTASLCLISSIATRRATPGNSLYIATKGALNSLTRAWALELASTGIRVNAILPGYVETSLTKSTGIGDDQIKSHLQNYPLGRFGKPEDVASLAGFLLSDASEWMTGCLIPVDGGFSLI